MAREALRAAKEALKAKNRNSIKVHTRDGTKPIALTGIESIARPSTSTSTKLEAPTPTGGAGVIKVGRFVFPITNSSGVERLEAYVESDAVIRSQYVS
ncbi:hypothetical protein RP20_CCG020038 [Aedes albopictus]|nr:hypothetical protein RP20_CCG020038 [Aedes albopictus]